MVWVGIAAAAASTEGSSKKKKKKKDKDKKEASNATSTNTGSAAAQIHTQTQFTAIPSKGPATHTPPPVAPATAANAHKPSTAKPPSALPKGPSATAVVATVPAAPPPVAAIVADITSRDEMVDHLLAMGFQEADCLAAITACGLDVDKAISWLCDRPSPSSDPTTKTTTGSGGNTDTARKSSVPTGKGGGVAPAGPEGDAQQKAQKDKEHKEELRRINRAWNARVPQQRAEEERRKVLGGRWCFILFDACCHVLTVYWVWCGDI